MPISPFRLSLIAMVAVGISVGLSGCGVGTAAPETPVIGGAIHGTAHGGQQPIAGARVYVMAANTNLNANYGNINDSASLIPFGDGTDAIGNYVITDDNGNFSLNGEYRCTSIGEQVYVLVLGGNPGLKAGTNNTSIGLMSLLGSCPNTSENSFLNSVPFLVVNEVSTIAAAYALAGYATDPTHIFTSGSALSRIGLKNAFANFNNLVDVGTGMARTVTPGNAHGHVPQAQINTLANILASCVNSGGDTNTSANPQICQTLFANTMSKGNSGATPTDTATAAINMAHNAAYNIANLYAMQSGISPFMPSLSSAPNDFSIPLVFDTDFKEPQIIAIDGSGNVWTTNDSGNKVTKLSSTGTLLGTYAPPGSNFNVASGIAIDPQGNAWIVNTGGGTLTELSSFGDFLGNFAPGGNKLYGLNYVAIDASGNVWVPAYNSNTVIKADNAGNLIGVYNPTGSRFNQPFGIAIDAPGNVWLTNYGNDSVTKLSNSGALVANYAPSSGNLASPNSIAFDPSGNAWISNNGNTYLTELTSAGVLINSYVAVRPQSSQVQLAMDGSGNAWLGENNFDVVTKTGNTGVFGGTFQGYFDYVGGLAIDGSGNIWVPNYVGDSVTELVGAAVPVVTPVVANLIAPYGTAPLNRP